MYNTLSGVDIESLEMNIINKTSNNSSVLDDTIKLYCHYVLYCFENNDRVDS